MESDYGHQTFLNICKFIEQGQCIGQGVLVTSSSSSSFVFGVIIAYLINRFRWTLNKSLEFMQSKMQNFQLDPRVKNCLTQFEEKLNVMGLGPKSFSWKQVHDINDQEEITLQNTYLNTLQIQQNQNDEMKSKDLTNKTKQVQWVENYVQDIVKPSKIANLSGLNINFKNKNFLIKNYQNQLQIDKQNENDQIKKNLQKLHEDSKKLLTKIHKTNKFQQQIILNNQHPTKLRIQSASSERNFSSFRRENFQITKQSNNNVSTDSSVLKKTDQKQDEISVKQMIQNKIQNSKFQSQVIYNKQNILKKNDNNYDNSQIFKISNKKIQLSPNIKRLQSAKLQKKDDDDRLMRMQQNSSERVFNDHNLNQIQLVLQKNQEIIRQNNFFIESIDNIQNQDINRLQERPLDRSPSQKKPQFVVQNQARIYKLDHNSEFIMKPIKRINSAQPKQRPIY